MTTLSLLSALLRMKTYLFHQQIRLEIHDQEEVLDMLPHHRDDGGGGGGVALPWLPS